MSSPQRPGPPTTGPAAFDAAEAAGLGDVAWADGPDQAAPAAGPAGPAPEGSDASPPPAHHAGPARAVPGVDPADVPDGDAAASAKASSAETPPAEAPPAEALSVEDLLRDLERVTSERDGYLDTSRRIQADFENYKKAVAKREHEARERANEALVAQILPVLDACDGALASGATDVEPVRAMLVEALAKQGLDRIDDPDSSFDPERHDAVMHEPAEETGGPVVAEVLRAGYAWKGRVVRPAMVRVRG